MIKVMFNYAMLIFLSLYSITFIVGSFILMVQGVGGRSDWKRVSIGFGVFLVYYISFPLVKRLFKKHFKEIKERNDEKNKENSTGYEQKKKGQKSF